MITGEGVHHSLTQHQLSTAGYYEGGEANKENRPTQKFSSHEKTSRVPTMKSRYYAGRLAEGYCFFCEEAGHFDRQCPKKMKKDEWCYKCREYGHWHAECQIFKEVAKEVG